MTRNRQIHFPSPFDPDDFDFERELWVPGKKKIFLPTVKPASLWDFFDRNAIEKLLREDMTRGLAYWDINRYDYCECTPGRSEYLAIPRNDPPRIPSVRTWNDVKRSTEPQFRSRRPIRLTDW